MTTATQKPAPWGTESVRLTLFPLVALQSTETIAGMWRQMAGADPAETTSKPAVATHQVQGPFRDGMLIIGSQPGRVDVIYAAPPQPLSPEPATLGPYETVVSALLETVGFVLTDGPPLYRLALGCVFLTPTPDRAAGYRSLEPFLPCLKLEPENSSDLSYQINRPRQSLGPVDDLLINRISKWSVQLTTAMFSLGGGTGPSLLPLQRYAARLETDVNTGPREAELPRAALPALVDELRRLTFELAQAGDLP